MAPLVKSFPGPVLPAAAWLLGIGLLLGAAPVGADSDLADLYQRFRPLLAQEIRDHRLTRPSDLYKFVFQGVMGPAHAVAQEDALRWLEQEWERLPEPSSSRAPDRAGPAIPLLQVLRPDSQLVRVHLEPLQALVTDGVPPGSFEPLLAMTRERLALAFVRTARMWQSEVGVLRALWWQVVADEPLWSGHFTAAELESFTLEVERAEWPAVHHSEDYRHGGQPHYRVVALELLPPAWRRADPDTGRTEDRPQRPAGVNRQPGAER